MRRNFPNGTVSRENKQNHSSKAHKRPTKEEAEEAVRTLLLWIGDDPEREGLKDTPKRVVRAYEEIFSGYKTSEENILTTFFEDVSGYKDPIVIQNIPFYSHCEHHMVPIIGKAHIAYIPNNKVVGLSKIPRLVDCIAKRLQTQEAITAQISDILMKLLSPKGVAIIIEAEHMCMAMRGVRKQGAITHTFSFKGVYCKNNALQEQFFQIVRK